MEKLTVATTAWQKDPLGEYTYIRSRRQPLIQRIHMTAIHIKAGQPVKRLHYTGKTLDTGGQEKVESWQEDGTANLRIPRSGAFPALTMEQLFAECNAAIQKFPGARTAITLFASGMLAECSVKPPGCVDDCGFDLRLEQIGEGGLSERQVKHFLEKGQI